MKEAMSMEEFRAGLAQIDLEETLGDYDFDVEEIQQAANLNDVEEAKSAIREILTALQSVSFGGFPVGSQIDLTDLVGFD